MDPRPDFHQVLKALFDSDPHVYFQSPANAQLKYPCIKYKLVGIPAKYADNRQYIKKREYEVMVIDRNPDSIIREKIISILSDNMEEMPEWDPFNFEIDHDLHVLLLRILHGNGRLFQGKFVRAYVAENLNHYVFRLYY